MPTTIYDSSLLTQRRAAKAVSGVFLTRLQNNQQGFSTPIGIYDQSIINSVKLGQMKQYRKNEAAVIQVNNGCPCAPLSDSDGQCGSN
jgi:hypothetical protein